MNGYIFDCHKKRGNKQTSSHKAATSYSYTSVHIWHQTDFQTVPLSEISNFAWFPHRQALKRKQPNLQIDNRLATGHIADTRTFIFTLGN
jgi:hypothetical protein